MICTPQAFMTIWKQTLFVIEWSEHIEEALPKDCIKIQIALGAHENERIFTVEGGNL